jgi:NTP pyrophosphatase (non-canonical NTP hydrolase)
MTEEELMQRTYVTFVDALHNKYMEAHIKHGYLQSWHEGYAVLMEEVKEVEHLVFSHDFDRERMKKELVDVAQVAMAFYLELCETPQKLDDSM